MSTGSWPGRALALAAATAAAAHLWLLLAHRHGGWATAVLLVMATLCLPCAVGLWRTPASRHAAMSPMVMSLAMAVAHWLLILGAGTSGHAGHAAGHGAPGLLDAPGGQGAATAMLAMVGAELAIAWGAARWGNRMRAGHSQLTGCPAGP